MLPIINKQLTNWVDGMKINRTNFIDSENALIDLIRDAATLSVTGNTYGLLHPLDGENSSLNIEMQSLSNNQIRIGLDYCRAITQGGHRIEVLPNVHQPILSDDNFNRQLQQALSGNAQAFYVVLSVNPFERLPFGEADGSELPPRNKYSIPQYQLSVVAEQAVNTANFGAHHLPIARVVNANSLVIDQNYIPPCATIMAHPGIKDVANTLIKVCLDIYNSGIEIAQKITNNQQSSLTNSVLNLVKSICNVISSETFFLKTASYNHSSWHLANISNKVVSAINNELFYLSNNDREEMLAYFGNWNNISPGKFQDNTSEVLHKAYSHDNCIEYFSTTLNYFNIIAQLFNTLKGLRLVGERSSGGIFTDTRTRFDTDTAQSPQQSPPKKKSIFGN
jgi:hypothetical protein